MYKVNETIEPSNTADAVQRAIAQGAILSDVQNVCPDGTKAWMLCLGYLEADEGFLVRGGNTSLASNKDAARSNKRRLLPMYCVLIEHPHEGLILWETGSGSVRHASCHIVIFLNFGGLFSSTTQNCVVQFSMISFPCVFIFTVNDVSDYDEACLQRVIYEPHHDLKTAIESTGHNYKDIKAVVIGHLHVDHAGGLDLFVRTAKSDTP
jgi:hypothetical protein